MSEDASGFEDYQATGVVSALTILDPVETLAARSKLLALIKEHHGQPGYSNLDNKQQIGRN
ncbi:MAG: hypothetical protein AAF478_03080 [Pseudomonadota bacterium]